MIPPAWRRHGRAAFVAFHVLAVVVLSLPTGAKLADRRRWRSARTQRELGLWAKRLGERPEVFEARLWGLAQRYLAVQSAVAAPFAPYSRTLGVSQGWGMFKSPQREPGKLRVEIHDARGWRVVYESRSTTHRHRAHQLDHNRMRKLVGRTARLAAVFDEISAWWGRKLALDFPDADRARITLRRFRTLPAARVAAGEKPAERVARRKVWKLARFRKGAAP